MEAMTSIPRALGILLLALFAGRASAAAPTPLPCAVEGVSRGVRASALCQALGTQLGRQVKMVADAREAHEGEAVQLISGDVVWTVIWLVDGRVRTWTRVSKAEPTEEQVELLTLAARELSKQAKPIERDGAACLRIDPNGGHKLRSSDLSYPWAELSPCKRKLVEVLDPWWIAESVNEDGSIKPAP
jgi:hypothetical protein